MNIFYVDSDPTVAAKQLVDKHVVKMPLETAQLLCSAFPVDEAPYRRTHYKHPSSVWTRQSRENYKWLIKHGLALCDEYEQRYQRAHRCRAIIDWCSLNEGKLSFQSEGFVEPPQCMPEDCKVESDSVQAYRNYYNKYKRDLFKWKNGNIPFWVY
jgi:hypothetical protein